jgi:hypothetical protein
MLGAEQSWNLGSILDRGKKFFSSSKYPDRFLGPDSFVFNE